MSAVFHDFTGSFCITAMSMLNPTYALTNIELVRKCKEYLFLSSTVLISVVAKNFPKVNKE